MEYGLVLLKPDGMKQEVKHKLSNYFDVHRLEVEDVVKRKLSRQQVMDNFESYPFDKMLYASYLADKEIIAYLVKGENIYQKLKMLKVSLRGEYGLDRTIMNNLIHTAAAGNEYCIQYKLFFNEVSLVSRTLFADWCVPLHKGINEEHITRSNLSVMALVSEQYEDIVRMTRLIAGIKQLTIIPTLRREFTWNGYQYGVLIHLPPSFNEVEHELSLPLDSEPNTLLRWGNDQRGVVMLDYAPFSRVDHHSLLQFKLMGLHGVLVYDPRRSIYEVQSLEEMLESIGGMLVSAGTNGQLPLGEVALDQSESSKMLKLLGYS